MDKTIDGILMERKETHGDYAEQSRITQALKILIRSERGYMSLDDGMREALDMLCVKVSRIVAGNATHQDHWDDISGYARLVSNHLTLKKQLSTVYTKIARDIDNGSQAEVAPDA